MNKLISLLAVGALLTAAIPAGAQAADLYKSKCQVCHGADGRGDTPAGKKLGSKDFHSPDVAKASDEDLFEITKKGKGKMPAYDKKLTDDEIKGLIKYIHALK
jgi:cytochrome c6